MSKRTKFTPPTVKPPVVKAKTKPRTRDMKAVHSGYSTIDKCTAYFRQHPDGNLQHFLKSYAAAKFPNDFTINTIRSFFVARNRLRVAGTLKRNVNPFLTKDQRIAFLKSLNPRIQEAYKSWLQYAKDNARPSAKVTLPVNGPPAVKKPVKPVKTAAKVKKVAKPVKAVAAKIRK